MCDLAVYLYLHHLSQHQTTVTPFTKFQAFKAKLLSDCWGNQQLSIAVAVGTQTIVTCIVTSKNTVSIL